MDQISSLVKKKADTLTLESHVVLLNRKQYVHYNVCKSIGAPNKKFKKPAAALVRAWG
jgi:hypothetical protein